MFVEDCSCATVSIKVSGNGDSIGVPVVESSSCINIYMCRQVWAKRLLKHSFEI